MQNAERIRVRNLILKSLGKNGHRALADLIICDLLSAGYEISKSSVGGVCTDGGLEGKRTALPRPAPETDSASCPDMGE